METSLMLIGLTWAFQARGFNAGVKNPTELESNSPPRNTGKPTRRGAGLRPGSLVIQHQVLLSMHIL